MVSTPSTPYMGKVLVLNVYHSFEWTYHAQSGSPLDDYQHLTKYSTHKEFSCDVTSCMITCHFPFMSLYVHFCPPSVGDK